MSTIYIDQTKEQFLEEYKTYPTTMGKDVLKEKPFYESRIAPIFYEVPMGSKVLDVGCNDGTFIYALKEIRKCDVYGVDISNVALEEARKKDLNVQFADVENLPFADETFDVITCMEVLSHLFDPVKAVKEMRRVLKKNGILLGSCPHKNLENYVWEEKRLHRRYMNEDDLHQLLSEGFEMTWQKVLTGAQFAISMADGFLGNEPCEILFKSGNIKTPGWDAALLDRSILRCWFGFTQGPGDVYYRMSGYADKMQKLGAEVHYNPYDENDHASPSDWCNKIKYLPAERRLKNVHIVHELETLLKASDLSVFQLTASRDVLLVLTTARKGVVKKPMLVEMDDWIFDLPSYNLAAAAYHPNSELEDIAYQQIRLCDGIITSTEYLKNKLNQLFPDKNIYVIKNSLDFDIWDNIKVNRPLHDENKDLIRIGYSGCGNHSGDLEIVKEPIESLLEEFPNLEFVSLPYPSTDDIKNPRYKRITQWVPMSMFPQSLSDWEIDIGIAPLRDNELNRSKSNLRWLEYSALKIPTIASKVYPFQNSITDGKDGILVSSSKKEWYDAIKALIVDQRERTAIGKKAYAKVKKDYNMDKVAKSYLSVLKMVKNEFIRASRGDRKTS